MESAEDNTVADETGKARTLSCAMEKGKHQSKNHKTAGKRSLNLIDCHTYPMLKPCRCSFIDF